MRTARHLAILILLLAVCLRANPSFLRAEDEKPPETMTKAERDAARKRAQDLNLATWRAWAAGRYEEGEAAARELVVLQERLHGGETETLAPILSNLATLLVSQGRYVEARPLYERALELRKRGVYPQGRMVALGLCDLASVFEALGQPTAARPLLERALGYAENSPQADGRYVSGCLGCLGRHLARQGAPAEARPLLERRLAIEQRRLPPGSYLVASNQSDLARVLIDLKQYDDAEALLKTALALREKGLGPEHPRLATSLEDLGHYHADLGNLEAALPLFERAAAIREKSLGGYHPSLAACLGEIAVLCERMNRYARAAELRKRCLAIVHHNVLHDFSGLAPTERLGLMRAARRHLDRWVALAPHLRRSAYPEVLRFKGLVARASAAERVLLRRGGAAERRRYGDLRAAERRLSKLTNSVPSQYGPDESERDQWRIRWAEAAAERERLALEVARDLAPLGGGLDGLTIGVEGIRRQLSSDAAFVDFLRAGEHYYAWIVRHRGDVEQIDLGEAGVLEAAVRDFTDRITEREIELDDEGWLAAGRTLRNLVLAPLEARFERSIRTLYLCPDAALATLPFSALPGQQAGRFLLDDYLLIYASMAQDLLPRGGEVPTGKGALLVGGVDYDSASTIAAVPSGPTPVGAADAVRALRGRSFPMLLGAKLEVEFIRTLAGDASLLLEGSSATEASVRAAAPGRRLLHLATHGYVRSDATSGLRRAEETSWLGVDAERYLALGYDPMLLAGLAMAGANSHDGGHGDDGLLTALEVSHMDLDSADLVVLSACETALGRAESGEGVIGLVRAFRMAGARRVVASLWEVDDEAARRLMERFYEGVLRKANPLPSSEALRAAARSLRSVKDSKGRPFSAPRHWAAFVAYGR